MRGRAEGMSGADTDTTLGLGVDDLSRRYRLRELSPVEVVDAVAARIERMEPALNAFVTLCLDRARREAEVAARNLAAGTARPLEGIPIAVKDLFDTEGTRTTYGSAMFGSHVPDADAIAVRRVREAGAIVVGKTSTHEFAWGVTTDNPHYGACRNPWDRDRVSGGSSGGSAAALAAGAVPLALGSDTGGSIRIPAALCGVVGLKPTYGAVSAAGVFPLAESLDHVGPMASRPRDAGLLYDVLAGAERWGGPGEDGECRAGPAAGGGTGLDRTRVGICPDLYRVEPAQDVERVLTDAVAIVQRMGATIVELDFPDRDLIGRAFATIQRAEALDVHRRRGLFPQRSSEYGEDVRERLELATEISVHDSLVAAADRARLGAGLSRLFKEVELLLAPVCAGPPVRIGEETSWHRGHEIDFRKVAMAATMPHNLAGLPACTVRGGFDSGGMPVGLQFAGPQWSEARTLAAAESFFDATPAIQGRWPDLPS